MKAFILNRGAEVIGEGIEFSDGRTVVQTGPALVMSADLESAVAMHNADGNTQFTYTEELRQT